MRWVRAIRFTRGNLSARKRKLSEGKSGVMRTASSLLRPMATVLALISVVPLLALAGTSDSDRASAARAKADTTAANTGSEAGVGAAPPAVTPCPHIYTSAGGPMAPIAPALASSIRDRVQKRLGGSVTSVCRTPFGLYEVVIDAEIVYVDERVNYLISGTAFDLRTQENLTAKRKEDVTRIDFGALPLQLAVKTVRGSGSRVLAVFEDPNCPYCKRFEKEIAGLTDATIYTFLYPILSRDASVAEDSYPKSKAIWCAPDRAQAWSQLMLEGKHLTAAPQDCEHPLEEILALGQKLHITGTPTLVFTDGRRAPGAIPLDRVEQMLSEAARLNTSQ